MASTPSLLMIRLLVVVLLLGGVFLALQTRQPEPPQAQPAQLARNALQEAESTTPTPKSTIGDSATDLPLRLAKAGDTYTGPSELSPPLAEAGITNLPTNDDWSQTAIEALFTLVEAGNVQAAVMLFRRHQRCAAYANAWRRAASLQQDLEQTSDERKRESLSAQILKQGERLEADAQCKLLPSWSPTTLFDLQLRAATLGDRQLILELAVNPALSSVPPIRDRDRYDRYQTQALGMLQSLVQRGDLDAVRLLADVHADPAAFQWLGQLVTRDEQIALIYAQLYLHAGGRRYRDRIARQISEWATRMLPADTAIAQNQAQALADRYFGPSVTRNEMGYGATGSRERGGWFEGRPIGGD